MTQDDKLKHSLEDLFSDVSIPEVEGEGIKTAPPSSPPPSEPGEISDEPEEPEDEQPEETELTLAKDMQAWREQLIQIILYVLVFGGGIALVIGYLTMTWPEDLALMLIYTALFAVLPLITFLPRIPYRTKVITVLASIYALGMIELIGGGLSGGGRSVLLTLPVLAVLLLGTQEGIIALILSFASMAGVAAAYSTGVIPLYPALETSSANWGWWLTSLVILGVMGVLLVLSQAYLIPRLAASLQKSIQLTQELTAQRRRLKRQARALRQANTTLRRRAAQLEASAEIGRAITSIFDLERLFPRAVDLIRDRFNFAYAAIFLLDEREQWAILEEATGDIGAELKAQDHRVAVNEASAVGWTAHYRQARIVRNHDDVAPPHPLLAQTECQVTLPMAVRDRLLGVLDVHSDVDLPIDENDVRALQGVADQIAIAIDNVRRFSEESRLLEATSPVYRVSRRLTTTTTPTEVANAIIESVAETEADGCVVVTFILSENDIPEALSYLGVWRRDREPDFKPGMTLPIEESPFPLDMVSSMWIVTDVEQDRNLPESARSVFQETGAKALVNIPLRAGGKTLGQVVVIRNVPGPFSENALRLYEAISDQASIAMERVRLMEETRTHAAYDRLVGDVSAHLRETLDIHTVLQTAAREIGEALNLHDITVYLGADDGQHDESSRPQR